MRQLVGLGISEGTVWSWERRGRLQRIHQGVFCVGHRALRAQGLWMAAVLACGPNAVLSHRAAAAAHDLRSSTGSEIEVTVPNRIGRSRPGIRVHSGDRLDDDEVTSVTGVACTSVARTILDLAAALDHRGLERLCETAERVGAFDGYALGGLIARHRGRRGVARLRRVLAEWDPDLTRTRSELEVRLLRLLIESGIERPVVNGLVEVRGGAVEVDFHWPSRGLIVETDGHAYHDTPPARRRDRERDRALSRAGWHVVRFGWEAVTECPERTLATIRRRLPAPPNGR